MPDEIQEQYNQTLENLSDELDIPPSKYKQAVERYKSVGVYLEKGKYEGCDSLPSIYPQGSFRLGTVVRPIKDGRESDYDIDLVCEMPIEITKTKPITIKSMIGDRLKENDTYKRMLDDEGRRCWTLIYAEQDGIGFHLDVLPCVPDEVIVKKSLSEYGVDNFIIENAIAITHKIKDNTYSWSSSNPKGYADWFDKKKETIFNEIVTKQKQLLLEKSQDVFLSIDDVPDALIKTPLQRAIQILKRHRDNQFINHEWENEKPISMIITTLSAKLYQQEPDVFSTLENIINQLDTYSRLQHPDYYLRKSQYPTDLIKRDANGKWIIQNPVNPKENFADRWHENNNRRAKAFFKWVSWAKRDLIDILKLANRDKIEKSLKEQFGEEIIKKSISDLSIVGSPYILANREKDIPHIEIKSDPPKPWGVF